MFEFLTSLFKSQAVDPALIEHLKGEINKEVEGNKVLVYSKSYCPYCTSTKSLLASKNSKFKVIELNEIENGSSIQAALLEMTGQKTVPNIFINGKHIGGNSDIQDLNSKGALNL